jgi:signal transduction histidine kinase
LAKIRKILEYQYYKTEFVSSIVTFVDILYHLPSINDVLTYLNRILLQSFNFYSKLVLQNSFKYHFLKNKFIASTRLLIICILATNLAYSQSVVLLQEKDKKQNIAKSSYFYEDKTGKCTIDSIQLLSGQQKFKPFTNEILNFGNSKSTFWIKLVLQNNTPDIWVVEISKPHMGYVSFFEPDENGNYVEKIAGAFVPTSKKDYDHNYVWFRLDKYRKKINQPVTYFIKLTSPNKTAPLYAGSEKTMFHEKGKTDMFYGICFGILIMVILYNLFIYLSIKETVYLLYLFYVLFIGLSNAIMVGFIPTFLTNSSLNISTHVQSIMALAAVFLTVFSMKFLEVSKKTPKVRFIFYIFLTLELSTIYFDFTKQYYYGSLMIQIFTMGSAAFLFPVSINSYFQGNKVIRFYIMAWFIGWIGIVSYILAINSIIPYNFFSHNGVLIGSIFESILFSLALADKINFIKMENDHANKRTLEVILENDKLIKQQNERLEKLVAERTAEIESKNIELKEYNENLESLVDIRTDQIKQANNELTLQNRRLEQYTFVTSHNIRGPVARLLGLIYLLKKQEIKDDQEITIVHKLEESTMELDSIIKDISKLLDIDRELNSTKETIEFEDLLQHIFLALDIPGYIKIELLSDFSEAKNIITIRPFIYSILYNLISNSIKFRDDDRILKVMITTKTVQDKIQITVSDNGKGMDLKVVGEKVFKPYQRFDLQNGGKGFGLFIVKTQVEALDGEITVDSTPEVGTTFTILIPKLL